MRNRTDLDRLDYQCKHCHYQVSTQSLYSGVNNRNHCPYCLHSKHVDLYAAGDRLAACKGLMKPIGITFKLTRKKYHCRGEMMLVHRCLDCGAVSINRIAADDIADVIYQVYLASCDNVFLHTRMRKQHGIVVADRRMINEVRRQLFEEAS